jgi:hypothetical protein
MRELTNDYRDLQVINLDPHSGDPGPYLVTQSGTAQFNAECRESLFVLRPDGVWVDINAYLGEGTLDGLQAALFGNLAQVQALLDSLPSEAKVAELPVSEDGLATFLATHPPGTTRQRLRAWVEAYEARRDADRRRQ